MSSQSNLKQKCNQKIIVYSVNGIKLSKIKILSNDNKIEENNILPILLDQKSDTIFMLSKESINSIKITSKDKSQMIPIDEHILKSINKGEPLEKIMQIKSDFVNSFLCSVKNCEIISYFYDFNCHLLYCLFNNGDFYRINLFPKKYLEKTI